MLCPDCQTYAAEEDIVCPRCGKLLNRQASEEEELMSFRQGRHLRRAESELPPPPVEPGSTGASRSFEDVHPRQSAEATGAMYSRREQLASTGKFYGLQDGALDEAPISYEAGGSATIMAAASRNSRSKRHIRMKRLINWAYVTVAAVVLVIALAIGTYLYLTKRPSGQVIMARMGKDATSAAMWQVGQEYLRTGDIGRAID